MNINLDQEPIRLRAGYNPTWIDVCGHGSVLRPAATTARAISTTPIWAGSGPADSLTLRFISSAA